MKNAVFCDVTPCGSCKNRLLGVCLHHQGDKNRRDRNNVPFSVLRLPVTANVPGSLIFVTLMMEARVFSETLVLKGTTRRNITEDGIRQVICGL
jgi:hypothetical protein